MPINPQIKKEIFEYLKDKMVKQGIPFDESNFEDIEEEIIAVISEAGRELYKDSLEAKMGAKRESNRIETPSKNSARYKGNKKKRL